MDEVLHANIFFFITGIAVIVFSALLSVAIFHGIKILRSLRRILDRIETGTEIIAEDMQHIRSYLTEDGFIQRVINTVMGFSKKTTRKESKAKKQETAKED